MTCVCTLCQGADAGDVWVKDGTLFDGDWYLAEGVQGPSRKIADILVVNYAFMTERHKITKSSMVFLNG